MLKYLGEPGDWRALRWPAISGSALTCIELRRVDANLELTPDMAKLLA